MLVLLLVLALLVAIGLLAARRPDVFEVARSMAMKAPPETIFPLIDDLKAFNTWNPFVNAEPHVKLAYAGPPSGPGASNTFDASRSAGQVTITESLAPSKVVMALDMTKPFATHNRVTFRLQPQGDMTVVTWSMSGGVPFLAKVVHLFVSVDTMVGGTFERGLGDLKRRVER